MLSAGVFTPGLFGGVVSKLGAPPPQRAIRLGTSSLRGPRTGGLSLLPCGLQVIQPGVYNGIYEILAQFKNLNY